MVFYSPAMKRFQALDTLRGLTIFAMILCYTAIGKLGGWMRHIEKPSGLTWVDLIFPFFLFCLGAAVPLAVNRRLEQGVPLWKILAHVAYRAAALWFLSVLWVRGQAPREHNELLRLVEFACLVLLFMRPHPLTVRFRWLKYVNYVLKFAAAAGMAGLMVLVVRSGQFNWKNCNVILRLLAYGYITGCITHVVSRNRLMVKAGLLVVLTAIVVHYQMRGGWLMKLLNIGDWRYLHLYGFLNLLPAVIGVFVGQEIQKYLKADPSALAKGMPAVRSALAAGGLLLAILCTLVFTYGGHILIAAVSTLTFASVSLWLVNRGKIGARSLIRFCLSYGFLLVLTGFVLEPVKGIYKRGWTPSYLLISGGFAVLMLAMIMLTKVAFVRRIWSFFSVVGKNALMVYYLPTGLVYPLLGLMHLPVRPAWADSAASLPAACLTGGFAVFECLVFCGIVYCATRFGKIYVRL